MNSLQVHEYIQSSIHSPLLLDVRENWEFDICHIEGSELIPMNTIADHLHELDRNREIILICHHGIRSRMVGRYLEQAEFKNIINLTGGLAAWAREVDNWMSTY